MEPEPDEEKIKQKFKGASNSPLLDVSGQLGLQKSTSESPSPESEECGRIWGTEVRKKALKDLERWPPDPGPSSASLRKRKPMKILEKLTPGKAVREERGVGDRNVLQRWLQREKEGSEASKTCLGPGNAKREETPQRKREKKISHK